MSFALASPPLSEAPPPAPKRAKSPPMAFEPTPNDALAARFSPPIAYNNFDTFQTSSSRVMSPNGSIFGDSPDLQAIVHKQSKAMAQLHSAFAAEREAWSCERDSLYQRISSLEKLLITNSGHRCVAERVQADYSFAFFTDQVTVQQNRPLSRRTTVVA